VQAQSVHWQHCTPRAVATTSRYTSYEEVSTYDEMLYIFSQPY
jgi:hypothetical protein